MTASRIRRGIAVLATVAALALAGTTARAAVSVQDLVAAGASPDFARYAAQVSASEGGWSSVNAYGCAGAFQFCPATLQRYYNGSQASFLNSPAAQVAAFQRYSADQWALAQRNGLTSAIGKTVCDDNGRCATVTESSILMACQFGCGAGGKLDAFVKNGYNCTGPNNTRDANGVSACTYLARGAGFDVAAVTSNHTSPSGAVACLVSLSTGAQALASPFNPGSGIGIAGDAGASVLAGHGGTAAWQPGGEGAASSVTVTSADGAYRTAYANLSTLDAGLDTAPPSVSAGTVLGQVGLDGGSPGFGVSMAVRQDVLKRAGLAGRTGADTGTAGGALSAGALASAADGTYYSVNPESFLSGRIPIQPDAVRSNPDAFAGRADTAMTLPTTCAPDPASIARTGSGSTGMGPSVDGGTNGLAGYRTGGADFAAQEAGSDTRGLMLDMARLRADDLRLSARNAWTADGLQSTLAHLIVLQEALRR